MKKQILGAALLVSALAAPLSARAQQLPTLVEAPPAAFPQALMGEPKWTSGAVAEVLIELAVDEGGQVVEAMVLQSTEPAFEEAAIQAAMAYVFTPALDANGQPAPARVQVRVPFQLRAVVVQSETAQLSVLALDTLDLPVPGLEIALIPSDGGAPLTLPTDSEGRLEVLEFPPGTWTVRVEAPGFEPVEAETTAGAGQRAELTLRLVTEGGEIADGSAILVVDRRETAEVVERVLTVEEIAYLPGSNGDVVKVVQNLPGVLRPPLGVGQLIIRGTAPEDSSYFLDGGQIPLVFHFSGLSTVINGDSLAEVAFLPGSYGVRYGRQIGGVVELRTKTAVPDEARTYTSVDLYQAAVFVERRIGAQTGLSLSGRRSYIDTVLGPALSSGAVQVQAPRYWDTQARIWHETERGDDLDALLVVSDDRFQVVGGEGEDAGSVQIGLTTRFLKARLRYLRDLGGGWGSETAMVAGPDEQSFAFDGDGQAYERAFLPQLRQEFYRPPEVGGPVGVRVGADLVWGVDSYLYDVASISAFEEGSTWLVAPGAYAELGWQPGRLRLTPGIRIDGLVHEDGASAPAIDPRVSARFTLLDNTVLKAGVGNYSGFPATRELLDEGDGVPTLTPERAIQTSFGFEQGTNIGLTFDVTGFYYALGALVSGRESRFEFYTGPPPVGPFDDDPYANDGTGRVCGVESLIRFDGPQTTALIAMTFSNSARTDRPGEEEELFRYDQPAVINALATRSFERGWRLGARLRYSSGYAYTPVVSRWYDLGSRTFIPVYGERSSERLPAFASLDLRFDKTWDKRWGELTGYLDLQNATNRTNPEVMAWTYDYGEEEPITSLPLLPVFGFKAEW